MCFFHLAGRVGSDLKRCSKSRGSGRVGSVGSGRAGRVGSGRSGRVGSGRVGSGPQFFFLISWIGSGRVGSTRPAREQCPPKLLFPPDILSFEPVRNCRHLTFYFESFRICRLLWCVCFPQGGTYQATGAGPGNGGVKVKSSEGGEHQEAARFQTRGTCVHKGCMYQVLQSVCFLTVSGDLVPQVVFTRNDIFRTTATCSPRPPFTGHTTIYITNWCVPRPSEFVPVLYSFRAQIDQHHPVGPGAS